MNFAQKVAPNTTIKVDSRLNPTVVISEKALNQMFIYTKEVADEVGWLGTAYKDASNLYRIEETFLFEQEVHATTTEITPEGLTKFAEQLLAQPGGAEMWNDIKMWGHSHVNMATNPSGQDDKQMDEFSNVGHDFFIRLICNKKGELRIDVYDYEAGLTFLNVSWVASFGSNEQETQAKTQIQALEEQIELLKKGVETFRAEKIKEIEEPIKAEIKAKVKKFVYVKPKNVNTGYPSIYDYNAGTTTAIFLEDFFTQTELQDLVDNCHTRKHFDKVLSELGMNTMLTYYQIGSLYSKLVQLRFMGGVTQ